MSRDAEVQEVQEIRLRDPWLYKLRMGGRFARERLAQMLNGLVSAPKFLVEASGRHVLALNSSRFLSTLLVQKYPASSGRAWMPGESAVKIPGLVRDYDCPKLALLIGCLELTVYET